MKNNHKFSFTPKNRRNSDIHEIKSFPDKKPINKIELEEPKEESFYFISPKKSRKNKLEEDNDDIFKTEMNNKKPLELFQEIPNDANENKKTLDLKQIYKLNNYDFDNNAINDKSNISMSFSNIIMNENISNDKIDVINNSVVKNNTKAYTLEERKNNCENKDLDKLNKFCNSMINKKNNSKVLNIFDIYNKTKKLNINNINSIKNYKDDIIQNHISFFQNLKDKKSNNIKAKLIKRTPRNKTYMNDIDEDINNFYSQNSTQKNQESNKKISYENSKPYCNNSNICKKFNSLINSARTHSLIQKNPLKINNQNSLYISSTNRNNKNKSYIKNLSYSKFIYKKRIIKMNKRKINKDIFKDEKSSNNKESIVNNICTRSFRKDKDVFNTFRINNIKSIKRKSTKLEPKLESKNDRPVNLKNNNFYSSIYESLMNKQKENCKNNIIIQNFNNYNLNTYNSNKNINPNFINFENYNENKLNERKLNNTTERNDNKRKNIILDIKINKRCFSKNSDRRNKKYIL